MPPCIHLGCIWGNSCVHFRNQCLLSAACKLVKSKRLRVWMETLHFFEEVPVSDDFKLLQDEEDTTANEKGLVFGQSLVQQQQVPLTDKHTQCEKTWGHYVTFCVWTLGLLLTSQIWSRQQTAWGHISSGADESACDPETTVNEDKSLPLPPYQAECMHLFTTWNWKVLCQFHLVSKVASPHCT